ncbi:CCA tRNA nucleotidyltransferase [Aurantimonas sp. Leaf443]|uniref:CCA tRNA nucleotidyltransferase n=1 Tax=Aurantimonas sp. Leaf443 TaxID=1736378 RepID=UPI0007015BF9|nr:CCA tRNA nucleotidyltransferase [Aurantimonas sp. Leaf443]KQT82510.1 poly(A) polymerase [Aurantimonas sp. Leaf443]
MTAIDAPFLADPGLQRLLACLNEGEETARVVGGAVRNALLGEPVRDIDIASTTVPEETVRRVTAAGFKAVPTGFEHGTITVVVEGRPFEVTTLRRDVETFGRKAKVAFGRDWQADAERRDFTMNALYCEADGTVIDLVGGVEDARERRLRFVGEAATRIEEDYLRILRFFRFFAWYGTGRPDPDAVRAATRLKGGLAAISAERIWAELRKLLAAPDPARALLWMRQSGVLTAVLPESERWGIDAIHGLVAAQASFGWAADPLLRLAAIVPPDAQRLAELAKRLRLSNADRDRLLAFATAEPVQPQESETMFRRRLYYADRLALADRLRLSIASLHAKGAGEGDAMSALASLQRMLAATERFSPPDFPVSGRDLAEKGVAPGPEIGRRLEALKAAWVDSGFVLTRDALLSGL